MLIGLQRRPLYCLSTYSNSKLSHTIKSGRHASTRQAKKPIEPQPAPANGQLPPFDEWKARFWHRNVKPTLYNIKTAREIVKGFGIADAKSPKVVLEAFAGISFQIWLPFRLLTISLGPGTLSRALCELPPQKLSKLIILEDNPLYLPYLEVLNLCHHPDVS